MEADWEVEIGPDAPVIEGLWPGFVDLGRFPDRIGEIVEARRLQALALALVKLNQLSWTDSANSDGLLSPIWTAKCDVWELETVDPGELNAVSDEAVVGIACYIDLLQRENCVFPDFRQAEEWARIAVTRLRGRICPCSRVDLVVRTAIAGVADGLGITAYLTGCGADAAAAASSLAEVLMVFVTAITSENDEDDTIGKSRSAGE